MNRTNTKHRAGARLPLIIVVVFGLITTELYPQCSDQSAIKVVESGCLIPCHGECEMYWSIYELWCKYNPGTECTITSIEPTNIVIRFVAGTCGYSELGNCMCFVTMEWSVPDTIDSVRGTKECGS
jgi:hypothetical protein